MLQMKGKNPSKNFRVPAAAQVIITGILPYAFLAYYPTLRLLDKMNPPPPLSLAPADRPGGDCGGCPGLETPPDLPPGDKILIPTRSAL
jgi:hypothetical protein